MYMRSSAYRYRHTIEPERQFIPDIAWSNRAHVVVRIRSFNTREIVFNQERGYSLITRVSVSTEVSKQQRIEGAIPPIRRLAPALSAQWRGYGCVRSGEHIILSAAADP